MSPYMQGMVRQASLGSCGRDCIRRGLDKESSGLDYAERQAPAANLISVFSGIVASSFHASNGDCSFDSWCPPYNQPPNNRHLWN